jgi:hypothetical protein
MCRAAARLVSSHIGSATSIHARMGDAVALTNCRSIENTYLYLIEVKTH